MAEQKASVSVDHRERPAAALLDEMTHDEMTRDPEAQENHPSVCCHVPGGRRGKMSPKLRSDLEKRMNRIEGQVRGIKGMIEAGAYCDDILHQITAVQSALGAVARLLLESHIQTCVLPRLKEDDPEILPEFLKTIRAMTKSV